MSKAKVLKTILSEYGIKWAVNRALYSLKLNIMKNVPKTDKLFEKKTDYPWRVNIFHVDISMLRSFLYENIDDDDKKRLINIADKACEGIITGFSSVELNYGKSIDWQLNPLTGKRCDEKAKWYKIPDFDENRGDIKTIWEASRFSHFITFARAYLVTNEEKYYKAFSLQLNDWLEKNPYGYGANFKCGQECAFRMINTLLTFSIFSGCGVTNDKDLSNVKKLVDCCYRKILSNFNYAYKCIKNNHTISELTGMIIGAWCCGNHKKIKKCSKMLNKVIDEQFTDDGGYKQFSFNYQRLALQDLEIVLCISKTTGVELNCSSKNKILKSAMLLFQCQDITGCVPNYGHNDGSMAFPVTSCSYDDYRPVINASYALISGNQLYSKGKHQEELLWFSGEKALEEYSEKIIKKESSQFLNAGLFTIRDANSFVLVVLNEYHSRPGHMDQMHIDLWKDGENILCDAGTYSYASEEGRQLAYNRNHNTVEVDGLSQMNTKGPFMIYGWTKRSLDTINNSYFKGIMKSTNGYSHCREVKLVGSSFEITDTVDKDYTIFFHTPCEVSMADGKALLYKDGRLFCEIRSSGTIKLQKTYRSRLYLQTEETNCLSILGQAGSNTKTFIEMKKER